jgi:hypothetical protein
LSKTVGRCFSKSRPCIEIGRMISQY